MKAGDWAKALSAVEEAVAVMPDDLHFRMLHADLLLHKLRGLQSGLPALRQFVRDAIDKNPSYGWKGRCANSSVRRMITPTSRLPSALGWARMLSELLGPYSTTTGEQPAERDMSFWRYLCRFVAVATRSFRVCHHALSQVTEQNGERLLEFILCNWHEH
ncbi:MULTISPECIES: hypothetical protein [Bradyrhizobium]|uniref:Tetratricopeptide repeat protein n=2 Tax=Bradyrhizobium quebecense TaxID=2748629 RepID=A0ABS3MVH3_9BRAD|nr:MULTISPECIES: hypothetical protein [Bradyrhizobium]UFX49340.1 hypothetical protein HAP47_0041115 [Bradyrhizobium sp. 41S5]UGY07520.1 hypothetical protein J4P68_0041000 [Bradyrhizobium quebecense]